MYIPEPGAAGCRNPEERGGGYDFADARTRVLGENRTGKICF